MPEHALHPFPSIDLVLPATPPRSRLYPLSPLGWGGPDVESLTSYLARLSEAHCVTVAKLAQMEFAPLLNKSGQTTQGQFTGSMKSLNGGTHWTAWTVMALEKLTWVEGLRCLSLYPWRNVLSSYNLLRPHLAWCPSCYTQWRQARETIYNPLLWHVRAVEICPHHRQVLRHNCPNPNCQRHLPVLNQRGKLGYCPYCHSWLGVDGVTPYDDDLDWTWQGWLTDQLAHMFNTAPYLAADPQPETFARNLEASLERAGPIHAVRLARQLGTSPRVVYSWLNHARPPHLVLLARLCYQLDQSLLEMLTAGSGETYTSTRRTQARPDVNALRRQLEPFLVATPPISALQVTRQLRVSASAIQRHFPEEYRKLVERYAQYRQSQQQGRKEQLQRELEAVLQSQETPPPSLREMARRLQMKPATLVSICPEASRLIAQRYLAHHRARIAKAEAGLRQALASNDARPPSLMEVATSLGEDIRYLYKRFSELCQQVTERYYGYRPSPRTRSLRLDHQHIRRQFAAIIAAEETPPPSIREVARRLNCGYATLGLRHRDLCDQLLNQTQAYQEAQISGLPTRLNQIVAHNESPAPSLRQVAGRLGVPPHVLQKACPGACAEILRRARADRKGGKRRRKAFLDQVLAQAGDPPLSLVQVAKILNTTDAVVQEQFPEESALITQRYQTYKAAERQGWQNALQAALASDQTPPPTLAQVAQHMAHTHYMNLRFHFPELCGELRRRRQAYLVEQRQQLQAELKAILAESHAEPPPPLAHVARRLGCDESALKRFFPDLVHAIAARRQAYYETKKLAAERGLQAVLEDERGAPPSLNALARQFGYSYGTLRRYFPDLTAAVIARRQALVQARREQRQQQLAQEVRCMTNAPASARRRPQHGSASLTLAQG